MPRAIKSVLPLPTGTWLAWERKRLGLHATEVANAVGRAHQAITSLERLDRVIPPGWVGRLRSLGMQVYLPTWPPELRTYLGSEWAHQIKTQPGLGHPVRWWSQELGVSETEVLDVLQSNVPVPQRWLLKLAELGVEVPPEVKDTLRDSASFFVTSGTERNRPPDEKTDRELHELPLGRQQPFQRGLASESAPENDSLGTDAPSLTQWLKEPLPRRRERSSVFLRWSEDLGLQISVSASVLEQMPSALKELGRLLQGVGLFPQAPMQNPHSRGA